ncbi:MAG: energy transducer TonB [Pseudomonadales bacterium]|jgi:hypothetical protein
MKSLLAATLATVILTSPVKAETIAAQINQAHQQYEAAVASGDNSAALESARLAYQLAVDNSVEISNPDLLITSADNLALLLGSDRRLSVAREALTIISHEVDVIEAHYGDESDKLIQPLLDRSTLDNRIRDLDRRSRSRRDINQALDIIDEHYPDESITRAGLLTAVAEVLYYSLRDRRSKSVINDAVEIYEAHLPPEDPSRGYAEFLAGKIHYTSGSYQRATEHLEVAKQSYVREDAGRTQMGMATLALLVQSFSQLGEEDLATEYCLAIGRLSPFEGTDNYQPIFKAPAEYPRAASRSHIQGWVTVKYTVDEQGITRNHEVVASAFTKNGRNTAYGGGLEDAAVDSAKLFRYAPRFINGEAVATPGVHTRVRFQM